MKKSAPQGKKGASKIQSKKVSKPSASKKKVAPKKAKKSENIDDILDGKKEAEIEGLEEGEQPLFFYGPPPALRILKQNKHDFDSEFHPFDLIAHMQEGSSRSEICAAWGITYTRFNEWLDRYPEFAEAYAVGKPAYDGYYKRALRFSAFGQMKTVRENSLFFMLKNQAGFTDSGGDHEYADGEGAEVDFIDDQEED